MFACQAPKQLSGVLHVSYIFRFAWSKESLLDLACGRGGDMQKWREMQV